MSSSWVLPIAVTISPVQLWPRSTAQLCSLLSSEAFVPHLTIASDVLHDIKRKVRMRSLDTGFLKGYNQDGLQYNIEDVYWTLPPTGEFVIPLNPRHVLRETDLTEAVKNCYKSCEVGHKKSRHPTSLDYFKCIGAYTAEGEGLRLTMKMVAPKCGFEIRKLEKKLKIVCAPLSEELRTSKIDHFRTGLLTMDQNHRVLPLLASEKSVLTYPLVGIWVAGVTVCVLPRPGEESDFAYKSLVWAACMRYVSCPQFRHRMGSDGAQFLLLKFPKLQFAEVTVKEDAHWQAMHYSSIITDASLDLELRFHHDSEFSISYPALQELSTAQFPDFAESSSGTNSTLDFQSISSDELPKRESNAIRVKERLGQLDVGKISVIGSPDVSPIASRKRRDRGEDLIRSQSTRSVTPSGVFSSQESGLVQGQTSDDLPRYEIFDRDLEI